MHLAFDEEDVFGKRKNTQYSPHIRSQMDLDTTLICILAGFNVFFAMYEMSRHKKFRSLRSNYLNSNLGKFEEDDFL